MNPLAPDALHQLIIPSSAVMHLCFVTELIFMTLDLVLKTINTTLNTSHSRSYLGSAVTALMTFGGSEMDLYYSPLL